MTKLQYFWERKIHRPNSPASTMETSKIKPKKLWTWNHYEFTTAWKMIACYSFETQVTYVISNALLNWAYKHIEHMLISAWENWIHLHGRKSEHFYLVKLDTGLALNNICLMSKYLRMLFLSVCGLRRRKERYFMPFPPFGQILSPCPNSALSGFMDLKKMILKTTSNMKLATRKWADD